MKALKQKRPRGLFILKIVVLFCSNRKITRKKSSWVLKTLLAKNSNNVVLLCSDLKLTKKNHLEFFKTLLSKKRDERSSVKKAWQILQQNNSCLIQTQKCNLLSLAKPEGLANIGSYWSSPLRTSQQYDHLICPLMPMHLGNDKLHLEF